MDSRSQFILQLLEKLGAPLMRAMNTHASGDATGQQDAQTIAALLSESVKISISLSQAMNLKTEDGDADAIRVGLATLAGGLIADSYAKSGRIPSDSETQAISKSLSSVLTFSDNFAPAAEHAPRLQTLGGGAPFFDPMQANLYTINALLPVIAAIAEFPFGQQETKLIQDVSEKLSQRATALRESLLGVDAGAPDAKMAEMIILQSLGQIYASAHRAETARLGTLSEEGRGESSLKPVWDLFDRQLAMVEVLVGTTGDSISGGRGGKGVKPGASAPAESAPAEPAQPATQPAAAAPAKPAGSPMSFFKKP